MSYDSLWTVLFRLVVSVGSLVSVVFCCIVVPGASVVLGCWACLQCSVTECCFVGPVGSVVL